MLQHHEVPKPLVRFIPPLQEQRQIFLLNVLRDEDPQRVLDLGCGEGSLLAAMCQPGLALSCRPDFNEKYGINPSAPVLSVADKYPAININCIHGLDISEKCLALANDMIKPPNDESERPTWTRPRPRWIETTVSLWKGGLQSFNDEFRGLDVITATEVIEHLADEILECFCPMVLGIYAPKVLVITTPNYDFNALFSAPTTALNEIEPIRGGYLDPSGRTSRVFRHHDHKFEWTRDEFQLWCEANARRWGYDVCVSGIGQSTIADPWRRDEEGGPYYATQGAIFRRKEQTSVAERATLQEDAYTLIARLGLSTSPHELFARHIHKVYPSAFDTQSFTHEEIRSAVQTALADSLWQAEGDIHELWNYDEVSTACGGRLEHLYDALIADGIAEAPEMNTNWSWVQPELRARWARRIRWNKYTPRREESLWESKSDHIPSWTHGELSEGEVLGCGKPRSQRISDTEEWESGNSWASEDTDHWNISSSSFRLSGW